MQAPRLYFVMLIHFRNSKRTIMNSRSLFYASITLFFISIFVLACGGQDKATYEIASAEYTQIAEQYLQHLAHQEFTDSYAFLADNVEFKLPDGDSDTRTIYKGLDNVMKFWDNYVVESGNNQEEFTDFVHIPVQVNQHVEFVNTQGVFDVCYFSATLHYGSEIAWVRMHWAFHFNPEKRIDGIFTYYDRTPIIAAAKKNFLASNSKLKTNNDMLIQTIKIKSSLSEDVLMKTAHERAEKFRQVPGLLQKYYTKTDQPGEYIGVYVWDSQESMQSFRTTELAKTIPQAYQVVEAPKIETTDVLFQLRD